MNASFSIIATAAAVLFAVPAIADTRPTPAPAAKAPEKIDPALREQRYCIDEAVTGSIIRNHECHTAAEWKQLGFDVTPPTPR